MNEPRSSRSAPPKTHLGRVAYAIAEAYGARLHDFPHNDSFAGYRGRPDGPKRYADDHWLKFKSIARAALVALQVPDISMGKVGARQLVEAGREPGEADLSRAQGVWAAMAGRALIDATDEAIASIANLSNSESVRTTKFPTAISAIPRANLMDVQRGTMRYTWRGVLCNKNPFDLALYPMLLWRQKPATIIEIGSKEGGSALWLWQTSNAFHIKTRIVSIDINQRAKIKHPHIAFLQGDGRDLSKTLTHDFLESLPRPWLVIEDADHHYLTTLGVLRFMDEYLKPGEYLLVEDGICDSFGNQSSYDGGPNRAIAEFLDGRTDYEIDRSFCDYFGYNVTWNTNGYLRKV